jgi:5-formyltetrahydrofolate cyclo-ligase
MQISSKPVLRANMKERLKKLPLSCLDTEGAAAARLLRYTPYWDRYETILLFLSASLEINSAPLLETALSQGKNVFVPEIEGSRIRFCRVLHASGPWKEGAFGIREPYARTDILKAEDFPVLVIVPGLAFDIAGNRLGRGKAYYDRFFSEKSVRCFKIGFCTDMQVLPKVPTDPWDVPMNALCTGSRFIPIAEEPSE